MKNPINHIFPLLLFTLACTNAKSQVADSALLSANSITFVADSRLQVLTAKQQQINKLSGFKNSAGQYKGFRVMVLNTNNRDMAYTTRAEILRFYPEQAVYMAYQAPYFKLKAGDFVKKADAEKFKQDLGKRLNMSLFVVPDIIKVSPEDEARLLEEDEKKTKRN